MRIADGARKQLRTTGRNDDAATRLRDHLRGFALRVGGDDDGFRDGEDPIQTARHDVARETRRETHDVDVGGGERLLQQVAWLVEGERDLFDLELLGKRDQLRVTRAHADDRDRQIVEIAQERRRTNE